MSLWRDASLSAVAAGFLVALVSYAGPLLIYHQAANAMGASPEAFSSWVFAISLAAGLSCIGMSLWLRMPIVTAWSAPGTVLLISIGQSLPFAEIVGAYLFTALVILAIGATGLFDRLVALIPRAVASGMMAGILFRFGTDAMASLGSAPAMFAVLLGAFLLLSIWTPRYTVILLLGLALAMSWGVYDVPVDTVSAHPRYAYHDLARLLHRSNPEPRHTLGSHHVERPVLAGLSHPPRARVLGQCQALGHHRKLGLDPSRIFRRHHHCTCVDYGCPVRQPRRPRRPAPPLCGWCGGRAVLLLGWCLCRQHRGAAGVDAHCHDCIAGRLGLVGSDP